MKINVGDCFVDVNHGVLCEVLAINDNRFHKYLMQGNDKSNPFRESEQALLSRRYRFVCNVYENNY